MTPQQVTKLRRVEVMRARLKKPRDPHIAQMQAYQLSTDVHLQRMERLARRQAEALEGLLAWTKRENVTAVRGLLERGVRPHAETMESQDDRPLPHADRSPGT